MTDEQNSAAIARRKGPWFWQVDRNDQPIALMQSGTGDYIATPQADISDYGLRVDCYIDIADDHAAMITAIPDLLNAAETAIRILDAAGLSDRIGYHDIKAAIAKATGAAS